jgi:hypothetical protein
MVPLAVFGYLVGSITSNLLDSLLMIRSKEEAARLALPRYPVAVRAMFRMWSFVMIALAFVVLLTPGFVSPLSYLWPWFLGIPFFVTLLSEGLSVMLP